MENEARIDRLEKGRRRRKDIGIREARKKGERTERGEKGQSEGSDGEEGQGEGR